ncbi:hypothetical protein [Enterococcus sp. CWB-B31]|uniref:hypothetical protein n=1 Tax=Enterococcus sp. CWB-B31 TaxID=2885159 RepID=UPI001E581855|nr:hypothetical protein [Enterococcus sp. CWB-B31]MCB5953851.1 hypothetical protein [Enterococcus sp. CWB-B31]
MTRIILIALVIGFILAGVAFTHFLEEKKWLPNRLITGCLVFLIILIPSMLFPQLPLFIKQVLYGVSGILAIVFFETSRKMLEHGQYKGIVKSENESSIER